MPTRHEPAEAEIRQQIANLTEAIRSKDLEALRSHYTPDVVSFDVEPPLQHVGIEAKLKNWAKVFDSFQELEYELRDLTLTVGKEVAFAHSFARLSGTLTDGTSTSGTWVRATLCFRERNPHWQITHDHASVPHDMRTGRGATDLTP